VFPNELTVRLRTNAAAALFPVQHQYIELLWLPVVGPSTTWLLRRLAGLASVSPAGCKVVLAELSESLGLGLAAGQNSSMQRSVRRLIRFGLADWTAGTLEVAGTVPPIPNVYLHKMSVGLVRSHDKMMQESTRGPQLG